MHIEERLVQEHEHQRESAWAETVEGEEYVSAPQLEGMVLEPIIYFNSSLLSMLNSILRPGPSKILNTDNLHVDYVNEALDIIITSIPEIHLNHPLVSSLEAPTLSCAPLEKPHYNLRPREKKIIP